MIYVKSNFFFFFFGRVGEGRFLDIEPAAPRLVMVMMMEKWWTDNWQGEFTVVAETCVPVPLSSPRHS
jgi:hypothetical protein